MTSRLIEALLRRPVDRTPVWLMRQAGRYLPEYRALRAQAGSFLALCRTPAWACEVTLQPLRRFPLDGAILFSDILTVPDAMGLGLRFIEGEGPCFDRPVRCVADIERLGVPDPEVDLRYVLDTVRLVAAELRGKVPLIGFAGSPWTLACYMVEGGKSKDFSRIKAMLRTEPRAAHRLLAVLAESVTQVLNAQIAAGAEAVMLFDTWGGVLKTADYLAFSLHFITQIIQGLTRERNGQAVPVILFTRHGGAWLEAMAESGCDAIGVDETVNIGAARARVGGRVALQGNLDPLILLTSPERIQGEAQRILKDYGGGPGHVFNLGHGVRPETPPDHVAHLVDVVHNRLS